MPKKINNKTVFFLDVRMVGPNGTANVLDDDAVVSEKLVDGFVRAHLSYDVRIGL